MSRPAVLRHVPAQPLPHVDFVREREPRRHDADDGVWRVVQPQLPADEAGVGAVAAAPQAIADDAREIGRVELRRGRKSGTDLRRDAEQSKQIGAGFDRPHADRIEARIGQVDVGPPPRRRVREDMQRAVVHEIDGRDELVTQPFLVIGVPDGDDPVGLGVRQRPQQDPVDNRVDSGRRSRRQSEHDHGDDGEGWMMMELPDRRAQRQSHDEPVRWRNREEGWQRRLAIERPARLSSISCRT